MTEPLRDIIWLPTERPTPLRIIAEVANRRNVEPQTLRGPSRIQQVAHARQEAMWELRQRTTLSTTRIGQFFDRDHSTVIHGIRAHEARVVGEGA